MKKTSTLNLGVDKVKILDTNVFLTDPRVLFAFPKQLLVIPISVIEELDGKKKGQDEISRNAREVLRKLKKLSKRGKISGMNPENYSKKTKQSSGADKLGIALDNGGRLLVELNHMNEVPQGLSADKVDNRILAVALHYKKAYPKAEVTLMTQDANLQIKAASLDLMSDDYEVSTRNSSSHEGLYRGYQEIKVSDAIIKEFETAQELDASVLNTKLFPNEYVHMISETNENNNASGRFDSAKNKIVPLIQVQGKNGIWGLVPLNAEQRLALDMLLNPEIPLITITGKAGTGKTLLAIATGLHQSLDEQTYTRMLVSRPVFPMGKDIGYLPGTIEEKLNPWMQPIFDNLEFLFSPVGSKKKSSAHKYEDLITQGLIKVEPLTYIRGRSIPHQFMIIDESQNLTLHEIKTIITRAGQGTKLIFTGDPEQIDNPYVDSQSNGLTRVLELLKDDALTAHVHLTQGQRSALAEMASEKLK